MTWRSGDRWLFAATAMLTAFAFVAPLLSALDLLLPAFAIRQFFSLVCHQDPARIFVMFGAAMPVCARCFGIYLGAALAGVASKLARMSRLRLLVTKIPTQAKSACVGHPMLVGAAALNLLDLITEAAGMHGNWPELRFALGISLGAAVVLAITQPTATAAAAADSCPHPLPN